MAQPQLLQRKPARSTAAIPCFCTKAEADHPNEKCSKFQARPCKCEHPYALHLGRCQEPSCKCSSYRPDATAEFLLRAGIRGGDWQFVTAPQLAALMRPSFELKVRAYACGLMHAIGRKRRLAVLMDREGNERPMRPDDMVGELNALDSIGRVDKHSLRKALVELQREGLLRRVGTVRLRTRLFFYFRPLTQKQAEDPDLGVVCDPQIPLNHSGESHLPDVYFSHVERTLVKSFFGAVRMAIEAEGLGVDYDHQPAVREVLDEALLVVKEALQKAILVVKNGGAYKEVSICSSSEEGVTASSSSTVAVLDTSGRTPTTTTTRPEIESLMADLGLDEGAATMLWKDCRHRDPEISPPQIIDLWIAKHRQLRNKFANREATNPVGLMLVAVVRSVPPRRERSAHV